MQPETAAPSVSSGTVQEVTPQQSWNTPGVSPAMGYENQHNQYGGMYHNYQQPAMGNHMQHMNQYYYGTGAAAPQQVQPHYAYNAPIPQPPPPAPVPNSSTVVKASTKAPAKVEAPAQNSKTKALSVVERMNLQRKKGNLQTNVTQPEQKQTQPVPKPAELAAVTAVEKKASGSLLLSSLF